MKNRFAFQPRYFIFWLLFFGVARAFFLAYHHSGAAKLPLSTILGTFGYGLRLDASAAAYVCLLPFLLFVVSSLLPRLPFRGLVAGYSVAIGSLLAVLITADLELYRTWGFRLDDTPLQYLNSPTEMAASAGSAPLLLLLGLLALLLLSGWGLYKVVVGRPSPLPAWFGRGRAALAGLLYAALLVVPLRGGTQQIPVNQSDVYFSRIAFANHAAINAPWNLMSALILRAEEDKPKAFMPDSTARRLVAGLYPRAVGAPVLPEATAPYLAEPRPNVLFIILESFTAKLVGSVGGERGVTPTLDSLARTGIVFTNIYAAGDRSQKGLVSLLSGYPNQPTTSIIKFPRKTEHLPHLARSLARVGYHSHYYYGGELAFANMKSYLQTAGYEHLTERGDFSMAEQNSKWGAHDGVLFQRLLGDLKQQPQPFFVTAFTLSSHEPFEVPISPKFPGTTEEDLFRNSVYYTDSELGKFLKEAQKQPWYAHTLLVLVADHGHQLPGHSANQSPEKFHIPLVLAGGALRPEARGKVVSTIGSQTDVAATLLRQLNLPATAYVWSRDLLAPHPIPFAYYCFNNGFGAVSPAGVVTFDNVSQKVWDRDVHVPEAQIKLGKAMQQVSLEDFARK
ncbi:sulfatase-like hydrolase/transferase [Hymenobacter sp. BT770]|uniref:LTA synthase family protein n=1 Tax=Hymenobacter sp. BT770 TaxID=2886942 RepID=UPI001D110B10|nr:alkaline phosphatase family protein [Hymenobacter sp. BT770]MCC3153072.1 sulfatase-like hydrolase/transferase [Hymenobacter sp. BT770]MDO3415015.1 sulfatase-like hydrolase/transferase [Hymenobacter sp. BT770]